MVEERISWIDQRQSAWQSLNFNFLNENAAARQPVSMPSYESPHIVSDHAGLNCYHTYALPADEGIQIKNEGMFLQPHSFPHKETSVPAMSLYLDRHQSLEPGKATTHQAPHCQQKKFLIFDRSGEETRMLLSTLYSPIRNTAAISPNPVLKYEFPEEVSAFKPEQSCPKVPALFGGSGENHVTNEGSDYHEDTDEINALLYSENDEDTDSCDSKDEDEISTDHSPVAMESGLKILDEGDEFDEEVNSWVRSSKRQKSLNGESCGKLCSVDTKETEKTDPPPFTDESVVDLNSSIGEQASPTVGCKRPRGHKTQDTKETESGGPLSFTDETVVDPNSSVGEQPSPTVSCNRPRGHKIQDTLRFLQKLIPGLKSKDPVIIIDEAIDYLKSLKATSLNIKEAEGSSCLGPCH